MTSLELINTASRYSEKQYMRFGHSVSLTAHKSELPDLVNPRSSAVLVSRSASYPVLAPDISIDLVLETHYRKNLHRNIYTSDSKAFYK